MLDKELEYVYVWGNNERREKLKGRHCKVLVEGNMRSILVEFLDTGEKVLTDRYAVRPI